MTTPHAVSQGSKVGGDALMSHGFIGAKDMENRVCTVLAMMHGGYPRMAATVAGIPVESLNELVDPKPEDRNLKEANHGT